MNYLKEVHSHTSEVGYYALEIMGMVTRYRKDELEVSDA